MAIPKRHTSHTLRKALPSFAYNPNTKLPTKSPNSSANSFENCRIHNVPRAAKAGRLRAAQAQEKTVRQVERARAQVRGRAAALSPGAQPRRHGHRQRRRGPSPAPAQRHGGRLGTADRPPGRPGPDPDADGADGDAASLRHRLHREHRHPDALLEGRPHLRQQPEDTPDDDSAGMSLHAPRELNGLRVGEVRFVYKSARGGRD